LQVNPCPQAAKGRERIIAQRFVDIASNQRKIKLQCFVGKCFFRGEMVGE
jgi:hypothetical protein